MNKEEAKKLIRARSLRATAPRVAVLQALASAEQPLSHTEVLSRLGETPWDSATTYRNLVKLREIGISVVASRAGGVDRYSLSENHTQGEPQHHFVCDDCGEVSYLPTEVTTKATSAGRWAASIEGAAVHLHGECPDCRDTAV